VNKPAFGILLTLLILCTAVLADTITLKNGDRLTGKIVKSDGKTLVIKTEFAGTVTVDFGAVSQITSDDPLNLMLKDGQKVVGKLASGADSKIDVETADTGKVELAKESIATLRSKEEEAAWQLEMERLRNPGIMDLWAGGLDFGLSVARGNAETFQTVIGLNAARATPRDKISVFATTLRASAEVDEVVNNRTVRRSKKTANLARGGVKYDVNITNKLFAFGFTELDFNEFQNIDFRGIFGGGLGYHAIKNERTVLDLFAGGAYNKTYYAVADAQGRKDVSSGEILFGEELTHKISDRSSLFERLVVFPNLSQSGEYRLNFDMGVNTALNKYMSWNVTISDRYLSNPPGTAKKNDVLFTTGIGVKFGNK
jgi:putative salt-induced outer membrane protein YdiY